MPVFHKTYFIELCTHRIHGALAGGFMGQSLCGAILQPNIKSKNLQKKARPNLKGKKQALPVTDRDGSDGWEKIKSNYCRDHFQHRNE